MKKMIDSEKLIFDYLEGNLDTKSKEELLNRINREEEVKKQFHELKLIWELGAGSKYKSEANTSEEWRKLETELKSQFKKSTKVVYLNNLLKYAAVLIFSIAISFGIKSLINFNVNEISLENEIYVPKGQKSQVTLTDGTSVWLNSESRLKYASDFGESKIRNVHLEGEAYFEVTKNEKVPFIVNTGNINIRVLGTSFNVKSYPNEKTIETTLIEGKVSIQKRGVSENEKSLLLKPNQKAVFNKTNQSIKIKDLKVKTEETCVQENTSTTETYSNPQSVISWKEEVLVFDNESLAEISIKLERWYGYTIEIKDAELLGHLYKGKFENLESINQVLDVIGITTPLKYKINGRKIYIEKK